MEHADFLIEILNAQGEVVGEKPRRLLDKERDFFHAVHLFVRDAHNSVILSIIPSAPSLPNRYPGRFGSTAASIVRKGEAAQECARRVAMAELGLADLPLALVGAERMPFEIEPGVLRFVTAFTCRTDQRLAARPGNAAAFRAFSKGDLARLVVDAPGQCAATLIALCPLLQASL